MEQAVNSFQKGLQMDTNPMLHGNDSLTDALNATLITMNGNEVALQNDMGNVKIDNAFLPAGYVPVGIKEHGGIIYVASYNPLTNRSLLGSFPSPERKYNNKDLNINQEIKLKDLKDSEKVLFCNSKYDCLKTDERIYNLTEKNIIRTGDKFALWFDGNFDDLDKLSNRNNTSNGKVISPKNKLYTLSVGVINSQNEFVDITKTLGRWNGNKLVKYTDKTNLYKFNDHYFIAGGLPSDATSPDIPKRDRELLKERQVKELNTYTYKLLGPLCIKTKLNHVESFSYNIYGLKTDDNTAELWIEGYITYNCPDGIDSDGGSDDNYINYCDELELSECFFDFKVNGQYEVELLTGNEYKTKYDPTTNLYTVKQVLHIDEITGNSGKIDYFIGVKSYLSGELDLGSDGVYLRDLSNCGTIDISKLGSGTYELKEWRFTSNLSTKTSTLVYTIEAYPKYGEKLDHLEATFRNVDIDSEKDIYCKLPLNNGTTQITFSWRDPLMFTSEETYNYLLDRALYSVSEFNAICLTSEGTSNNPVKQKNEEENLVDALEFFLTTERMNSCFNPRSEDFIRDYGFPRTENEIETFQKKLKIELITDINLDDLSKYKVIDKKTNIISTNSNLSLEYTSEANINIINKSTISIKDLERLYPSYIALSPDADSESIFDLGESYLLNKNLLGLITINSNGSVTISKNELAGNLIWNDSKINIERDQAFENSTDKSIQAIFEYKDIYKSVGISNSDTVISNGFVTLTKTNFKKWFDEDNEGNYGGVCYGTIGQTGHDDIHEVRLSYGPIITNENGVTDVDPAVICDPDKNYTVVTSRYEDDWIVFTDKHSKKVKDGESEYIELVADDYESKIYETMNLKADRELFLFRFFDGDSDGNRIYLMNFNPLGVTDGSIDGDDGLYNQEAKTYARLWWRNSDTWSLIKFVINKTTDYTPKADKSKSGIIYDFLLKCGIISLDLVYAMYKFITAKDAGIFIPDFNNQIYNNFYEITFPFEGFITIKNTQNCIKLLKALTDKDIDKIGLIKNINSYSDYETEYGEVELNNNTFYFQNPEKNDCKVEFYIETTIKSSREFLDIVDTLKGRVLNLSNIYLETGQTLDADGNQLHSRNLYNRHTDINGNVYLVRYNFSNFQITEDFGREGILVIIPNIKKGIPEYRYDIYIKDNGGADRKTILDYANFNIVDSPILTPGKNS